MAVIYLRSFGPVALRIVSYLPMRTWRLALKQLSGGLTCGLSVRWGQIIDPDIERADCAAYAAALEHLWRQSVSLSEIAEMGRVSVTGAEFEARMKKRYRPLPVKGFEVGRHLGEQFLIRGVPEPLVQVTHAALLLSRGFEPEPFSPRVSSELVNLGLTSA